MRRAPGTLRLALLASALATSAVAGRQVSQTGLSVDEIVARHVSAVGGEEALSRLETLKKTGVYVYNGHEHPIISYHARGRMSREEIEGLRLWGAEVWEGHRVLRGTNGRLFWNLDASREPQWNRVAAERVALELEDAELFGPVAALGADPGRLTLSGLGELDGTPAYELTLQVRPGLELVAFVDAESFLLLGKRVNEEGLERDLERPRAWFYDDYRPVAGVMVPFSVYIEEALFSREYIYESIEANVRIESTLFEPPEGASKNP